MRLQREVSRVKEADYRVRHVSLEGRGSRRQEERIVLAPGRKEVRFVGVEIGLKGGIERDIALVVAKQIELYLVGPRPSEVEIVERVAVRRDYRRVTDAVRVLPDGRFRCQESAQRVPIGLRRFFPIGSKRRPAVA